MPEPTEAGYYWLKHHREWIVVEVHEGNNGIHWMLFPGDNVEVTIMNHPGEWGPRIEPPEVVA